MTSGPTVAVCGAGTGSFAHLASAQHLGLRVVAVASRSPARARERAAQVGARPATYAELPAGADIVVVATPPEQHAPDALRLLAAGAAVLVETPMCSTLADADALVEAAELPGARLLYGEQVAFAPVVHELLRRAPSLGVLSHLQVRALQPTPTWRSATADEWGGGALFDLGVHPLALALLAARVCGAGEVTGVAATVDAGAGHDSGPGGADEHAEVAVRFSAGLVGHVVASWQAAESPVWDAQLASATGVLRAELVPEPELLHNGEHVPVPRSRTSPPHVGDYGYLGELRTLVDDLSAGRRPFIDARFGRLVLEVVCAAYESAGRGGVEVPMPFAGPRHLTPVELWRAARRGQPR
jgi:predicted dehydrogenase